MRLLPFWLGASLLLGCRSSEDVEGTTAQPLRLTLLEVTPCPAPPGLDAHKVQVLGVRVRVEGHHPRGVPANYFYASLLTNDQARYLAERAGCSPVLAAPPLEPGQSAEGFLNFPVPVGKTIDTLVYAPRVGGPHDGEARVELALGAKHGARASSEEDE